MIRAGRHRRLNGRARVYKRPAGVKCKYRPGIGALHEIRHYQRQASSALTLQEGFEDYLITFFHDKVLAAIHGRCKTVMPKDIHIVCQLHTETHPYAGSISMRDVPRNLSRGRKRRQDKDELGNNLY